MCIVQGALLYIVQFQKGKAVLKITKNSPVGPFRSLLALVSDQHTPIPLALPYPKITPIRYRSSFVASFRLPLIRTLTMDAMLVYSRTLSLI